MNIIQLHTAASRPSFGGAFFRPSFLNKLFFIGHDESKLPLHKNTALGRTGQAMMRERPKAAAPEVCMLSSFYCNVIFCADLRQACSLCNAMLSQRRPLSTQSTRTQDLECDVYDDPEGPCDGCSLKVSRKGRDNEGKLNDVEALHLAAKLHMAATLNDKKALERAKKLIDDGANINSQNEDGCTAIWIAAKHDNVDMMATLIKYPDADLDIPNKLHWSPVFIAAKENRQKALKILIDARADINVPEKTDNRSPAYIASVENNAEALRMLIDSGGADINIPDKKQRTPVWVAAQLNHVSALKVLLADGEPCNACLAGTCKMIGGKAVCGLCSMPKRPFKNYFGADIHKPNAAGESPVWIASQNGSLVALKTLIGAGANVTDCDEVCNFKKYVATTCGSPSESKS